MIPKDLKVGETFEEDGRTYEITKVIEYVGYESTAIKPEEIKEEMAELSCQYCNKVITSQVGLNSHEKACLLNPENREKLLAVAEKNKINTEGKTDLEIYTLVKGEK